MKINDVEFNADCETIISELQTQLRLSGIELLQTVKSSGDDIMIQCPYHGNGQEKRPSAGIRKSDGIFHCFACGEIHTLAEVVSHCFDKDETGVFGWKWLLKNFGTVSVGERKDVQLDFGRADNFVHNNDYVTEEELSRYRYYHPYMYMRKLTDEIIECFDVGYDSNTNCITFPVRDVHGHTLFIARRSVNYKYFNYPKGIEKPLYGLYELKQEARTIRIDEVIVCESMLDALTCWVYGKYAVALNGLGNELQFKQLRDLPCRKLILATDNDKAGQNARRRIRDNVKNKIITEYVLPLGKKDINDLTKTEFDSMLEVF